MEISDIKNEVDNPLLIFQMIKETIDGNYSDVHSVLINKNNKLILEEYFYCNNPSTPHQLLFAPLHFVNMLCNQKNEKNNNHVNWHVNFKPWHVSTW